MISRSTCFSTWLAPAVPQLRRQALGSNHVDVADPSPSPYSPAGSHLQVRAAPRARAVCRSICGAVAVATLCGEARRRAGRRRKLRRDCRQKATSREQQVIPFTDPKTGAEVVLIACMHFNPRSIDKATSIARQLVERGELGSVVVESCPTRWQKIQDLQPAGSPMRMVLDNEMQAAAEQAEAAGLPVVLGDQRIEELGSMVTSAFSEAFTDLTSPLDGGWQRIGTDIVEGVKRLSQKVEKKSKSTADGLNPTDFLDPFLLLGTPITIVRYVLSLVLKSPQLAGGVAALLTSVYVLSCIDASPWVELFELGFDVVWARVFLAVLLRNRDTILATSISDACKEAGPGKSVVAVLGAAHCNGVRRLILDRDVTGQEESEPAMVAA